MMLFNANGVNWDQVIATVISTAVPYTLTKMVGWYKIKKQKLTDKVELFAKLQPALTALEQLQRDSSVANGKIDLAHQKIDKAADQISHLEKNVKQAIDSTSFLEKINGRLTTIEQHLGLPDIK